MRLASVPLLALAVAGCATTAAAPGVTAAAPAGSEEDLAGEDRAHWYARQVMGSSNFETGRLGHLLSGHLGFQIEHHLFPNIPAWRYPEMAPRVRDICERHGVPYQTGALTSQFVSAMRRLVRFAVPGKSARGAHRGSCEGSRAT